MFLAAAESRASDSTRKWNSSGILALQLRTRVALPPNIPPLSIPVPLLDFRETWLVDHSLLLLGVISRDGVDCKLSRKGC